MRPRSTTESPSLKNKNVSKQTPLPIKKVDSESYDTMVLPYSNLLGVAGENKIVGNRLIGPDGQDIKKWLPLEYNLKFNKVILKEIYDYKIVKNSYNDLIIVYLCKIVDSLGQVIYVDYSHNKLKSFWKIHRPVN